MAASYIGSVGPYIEEEEEFDDYCGRVEVFMIANAIKDDVKVATFLTIVGPKLYKLIQNLISPKKPKEAEYDDIIQVLKNHYKPKVITIFERYKFYNRKQEVGESVSQFVAGIRAAAHTCDFGDRLNEMLRDRLVVGIRDEGTQRALLTETGLTFNKAIEVANAREAAAKDVKEMGKSSSINLVNNRNNFSNKPKPNFQTKPNFQSKTSFQNKNSAPKSQCNGCGGKHWKKDCPFKGAECHNCRQIGHIKKMCFSNKSNKYETKNNQTHNIAPNSSYDDEYAKIEEYDHYIYANSCNTKPSQPILVPVEVNKVKTNMELDTGATRSLISMETYQKLWPNKSERPQLEPCDDKLRVYGGSLLPISGQISVNFKHVPSNCEKKVVLIVVDKSGPNLLGRDILKQFKLLDCQINSVADPDAKFSEDIKSEFPNLFKNDLGCFKEKKFSIKVNEDVKPVYCKPRVIPYTLRTKVEKELERLQEEGAISPITHSNWAAPIVPVLKSDNSIRICGDYRLTANKAAVTDCYPIPKIDSLFACLAGGKYFSKLDMSQAYAQLELEEKSKPYTVINTSKGLFKYNRLCFGISSAPGIFQRAMEDLLKGVPGVLCYLDDILVCGSTEGEHLERLKVVLAKLQEAGLRLRLDKCSFKVAQVSYLGYVIDASGIHPAKDKVRAIVEAPVPKDKKQLQSYLGIFNFYRRFVSNCSTILEPLNMLLRDGVDWKWTEDQDNAFKVSKTSLLNSNALVHFDTQLPITIISDSSAYGVGAVLCHSVAGQERPVTFASRTLNKAERNYSQLEKEALAIVFALKKFHNYVWGQPSIKIVTDHKPLLGLFSPDKPIPPMASGRIQRWALMLQAYNLKFVHRSGALLGTADALSRLPLPVTEESVPIPSEWTNLINFLDHAPITASDIKNASRNDAVLSKVIKYCEIGWPQNVNEDQEEIVPYFRRKNELSVEGGCLLWGYRVIIPAKYQSSIIAELHGGHVGVARMKELARSYIWWPKIDSHLEEAVKNCDQCLQNSRAPSRGELHPWEWPSQPWHRLHLDYAGPIENKYYLVLVDAYSKWVEIFQTNGPNSKETIKHLKHCFCTMGLPVTIVSDNGPCFTSAEFKDFLANNGIRQVTSAPYKPSTNGLAEKMVQTFKTMLKKSKEPISVCLDKFLFKYRVTPHSTTGVSPAELLFKRKLRCRLNLLSPYEWIGSKVSKQQESQKRNYSTSPRKFNVEPQSNVVVRNYGLGSKWLPGIVEERTGPVSYRCRLPDGSLARRHQDQIIAGPRSTKDVENPIGSPVGTDPVLSAPPIIQEVVSPPVEVHPAPIENPVSPIPPSPQQIIPIRRSTRRIKAPDKLDL